MPVLVPVDEPMADSQRMSNEAGNEAALLGRGVMLIDQFAEATGLDRRAADALVTERKVEGLQKLDGAVFGVFDDALPTKEQLRSWGLNVRDDYDPDRHRSYVGVDDEADAIVEEDGTSETAAGWNMAWPEGGT